MKKTNYPIVVELIDDHVRLTQDWMDGNDADVITLPIEQGQALINFITEVIQSAGPKEPQ